MTFCDFCGEVLDEDEKKRSENFKHDVCDECILSGLETLQKTNTERKRKAQEHRKHSTGRKRMHRRLVSHVKEKHRSWRNKDNDRDNDEENDE